MLDPHADAVRSLDPDRLQRLVADALRLEGFTRLTEAPMGSVSAERLEVRHGRAPERVRWIARALPAGLTDQELLRQVQEAEKDLHACASRRILLWCAAAVPPFLLRMNQHLPASLRVEIRGGDRLAALARRATVLAARHLPELAHPAGRYGGWRVLFLHDGSPLDYELLRRLEREGAWVVGANLLAHDAALEGLADLFEERWSLVIAFAGDVAASAIAAPAIDALAAHLTTGGDVLWNPWIAWAARYGSLAPLAPLLPVELAAEPEAPPMESVIERRDMRVTTISADHLATRSLAGQAPFALVNTFEPLRLAAGATALATTEDGAPFLAVATRGRGRSVYLNASGHSCVGLAVKHSPIDEAPAVGVLLDGVTGWLYDTRRAE